MPVIPCHHVRQELLYHAHLRERIDSEVAGRGLRVFGEEGRRGGDAGVVDEDGGGAVGAAEVGEGGGEGGGG
ncbi:hypothetical protein IAQ61_002214 [Plenodomus lingam]|uniref:uncharacterized protein n=1 Tax=Leptosphaeria maculans TaxID=5022 RepID=UPI00332AB299|nr:hypothetical protein IAQ61_002214 [Plenodomus lingam]